MIATSPPAASPARVMDRERRPLTIGLLLLVSAVAFEAVGVATILPAAVDDLGWLRLYGWTFSAFMLTSLVSTVAAGRLADQRGPAGPVGGGLVLFGAGLLVAGLAPSMPLFLVGRALQGAGAGVITAMAYVSIGRAYPDALRPQMMAYLSGAWVIPGLIGPGVAGITAEHLTWRLVFLGVMPLLPVAGALLLPALRRMAVATPDAGGDGRLASAVQLAAGAGLLLAGLGLDSLLPALALVAVGLALAWRALHRLMPAGTLTARVGLPAGIAVNALLNFGFFTAEAFLPLGLTELRGQSAAQVGIVLTAVTLTWSAGSWLQARLDARDEGRGRRTRVALGVALLLVGSIVTGAAVLASAIPALLAAAGWAVAGLGMGIAYPTVTVMVLRDTPAGREGAVSGSLRVAEMLAIAMGTGIGGAAVGLAGGPDGAPRAGIAAAFLVAIAGTLLCLIVTHRLSHRATTEPSTFAPASG